MVGWMSSVSMSPPLQQAHRRLASASPVRLHMPFSSQACQSHWQALWAGPAHFELISQPSIGGISGMLFGLGGKRQVTRVSAEAPSTEVPCSC